MDPAALPESLPQQIDFPLLIGGIVLSLFGWTLYWAGLRAAGLALGGLAGGLLGLGVVIAGELEQWALVFVVGGMVIGAIIGVFAIKRAHFVGCFFVGALGGVAVARLILPFVLDLDVMSEASPEAVTAGLYTGFAAVMGFLTAWLSQYVMTVATALIGSALVALSLHTPWSGFLLPAWFVVSMAVQFGLIRRFASADFRRQRDDEALDG